VDNSRACWFTPRHDTAP